MAESNELKKIKKLYGEKFMHLCRELFPTILEKEGALTEILNSTFATNSRTLYEDIMEAGLMEKFKGLIYSRVDVEKEEIKIKERKTPYQLLEEAGYDLYECNTEEEIQSFKKYYKENEELCTFRGGRLDSCVVFWAVKKEAENIDRNNFKKPQREDEYGTSVMSIQFSRGEYSTVSIKNRYNHTVNNPDATYGNDLDRIKLGLAESFKQLLAERGMKLSSTNIEEFMLPDYVVAADGKYYKYNDEIDGIYYCPGNTIIHQGRVKHLEPEKQILIDEFIIDKEKKEIKLYDERINDSFVDTIKQISNIEVRKSDKKNERIITITNDLGESFEIEIDCDNRITGYKDNNTKNIDDGYLSNAKYLTNIEMKELEKAGNDFLWGCSKISNIEFPKLRSVKDHFLFRNQNLTEVHLPKLEEAGDSFLYVNEKIKEVNLPKLKKTGKRFLRLNILIKKLSLPELEQVGAEFIYRNEGIKEVHLPKLKKIDDDFFPYNTTFTSLDLPNLEQVGDSFLQNNESISKINFPKLKKVGHMFMACNSELTALNLPKLEETGECFLHGNKKISEIELPKLKSAGFQFLYNGEEITEVNLPNLEETKGDFLYRADKITHIELPKIKEIKRGFVENAQHIGQNVKYLKLPKNILEEQEYLRKIVDFNEGEIVETESTEEVRNDLETNTEKINRKDIAELSKETAITTTEVSLGKRFLNKIKELFKHKENDKRGEK